MNSFFTQLTDGAVPVQDYGANGNVNGENGNNNNSDDSDDDSFTGGETSFRDAKALPNVIATLNTDNVWLSTRGAAAKGIDRTESGQFVDDQDKTYKIIPSLSETRVALVCDSNLTAADKGGLFYDETAFYNDAATPYFVVTVNPYIYRNIMQEVWHSTTVPCGMYFCCQGGDGAHTGEAHEDFVSIQLAYVAVGAVFLTMLVVALLPGDEEWSS